MATTQADYDKDRESALDRVKRAISHYHQLKESYKQGHPVSHSMDHARIEALEASFHWRDLFTLATGPAYEEGMQLIRKKLLGGA